MILRTDWLDTIACKRFMMRIAEMTVRNQRLPTREDWGDGSDPDVRGAYKTYFGKTNDQLHEAYYRDVLSRVSELRFMPTVPFQYYMLGFRDFVVRGHFRQFSKPDVASSFLELIEDRIRRDPTSVCAIVDQLDSTIDYVAKNQSAYEADAEFYGSFEERAESIRELLDTHCPNQER